MAGQVDTFDVGIVGAGPAGLACAIEARKLGLRHVVFDKGCITDSIFHFPVQMVFFTTPELLEIGDLPLVCEREKPTRQEGLKYYRRVVEALDLNVRQYEEVRAIEAIEARGGRRFAIRTLKETVEARTVVLATGYYGNPNLLGIPGESLAHVSHYYTEAHPFFQRDVVIIGGKNSAAEAALELYRSGARVTLVHRGAEMGRTVKYWVRPDIDNRISRGEIRAYFNASAVEIGAGFVRIVQRGSTFDLPADQVFALTGYHPCTKFFDQLGVQYDRETLRPALNSGTFETSVAGVYLAGSIVAGRQNGEIFIENGRFHGQQVAKAISGTDR